VTPSKLVLRNLTTLWCCCCLCACVCVGCSLVPLCDVLTPNQFEAELLTGLPVTTEQQALQAAEALHKRGPHTVVSHGA
jgi:pyridoxal/pyridoxine/pyridoxamine kinase